MAKVYAAILAGGIGTRMGNIDRPKQYLELAGKPVIIHTVEKFAVHSEFEAILVLCPKAWIGHTKDLMAKYLPAVKNIVVLEGGATRNGTIMNAVQYVENKGDLDEETILVTHDAVRPFISRRMIEDNIQAAREYGACDTVIAATDTIVEGKDGKTISSVPDRKFMYQGQTPQSFRAAVFKEIYTSLTEEEREILTDACKAFVIKGKTVRLVEGDTSNIKITHPADLLIARAIAGGIYAE